MKLAYVTEYDARNVRMWSGTGYFIAESLSRQSIPLEYIGPLKEKLLWQLVRKYKRQYHALFHKRYMKDPEPLTLKDFAQQISQKLSKLKTDIVFSATTNPIAYLECNQPIVFWADATFANILDFYPQYSNLCQETIRDWHRMEQLALEKSRLAIYSSDWAAQTAIDYYKADAAKVKVVPFGANIHNEQSLHEVKDLIEARPSDHCKILFLGVDWYRKGGDVALKVATELNKAGLRTELTVVGCQPVLDGPLPDFVKPLGFISKATEQGKAKIYQLITESHFLILPSRADCTPIVFCEANSFGVPCLTTNVGGIPTIIRDDVNGKRFDLDVNIDEYCSYIFNLFEQYSDYKQLAISSFKEYETRLNWTVAGKTIKDLLSAL
ncbi:MAG: hypothetical protein Kow00121_04510 [Elainellaceae cyanobacterium]